MQTLKLKDLLTKGFKYTEYDVMKDTERLLLDFFVWKLDLSFFLIWKELNYLKLLS